MNEKLSEILAYIAYFMIILIGFLFGAVIILWLLSAIKTFI